MHLGQQSRQEEAGAADGIRAEAIGGCQERLPIQIGKHQGGIERIMGLRGLSLSHGQRETRVKPVHLRVLASTVHRDGIEIHPERLRGSEP